MRYLVAVIVSLLIFFLALPPAVHWYLERELAAQIGETHIGEFDLNIFRGQVRLGDLTIDGLAGSDLSGVALDVDLGMAELFGGELVVESIGGEGLALVIEEDEHGHLVVMLSPHGNEAEPPQEPVALPAFRIQKLWLKDSAVTLHTSLADGRFQVDSLSIDNLSSDPAEKATISLRADWDGAGLAIDGDVSAFAAEPAFSGKVVLERLDLEELAPLLPVEFRHLQISGLISTDITATLAVGEAVLLELNGDLSLADLSIVDGERDLTLVSLDTARVESIALAPDYSVSVNTLRFEGMTAVNSHSVEGQWVQAREIVLQDLDYADNLLQVKDMQGSGVRSVVRLTATGELEAQGVLSESLKALAASTADTDSDGSSPGAEGSEAEVGFAYALGRIMVTDSVLLFQDEQFSPPLNLQLDTSSLELTNLDSREPEAKTGVELDASVGEYGTVKFAGDLSPLSEQLDVDLKGEIDQMRLALVSPYVENLLAYELTAGQYDHVFDIQLVDNQIKATNQLQLRNLKVEKMPGVEAGVALPVPLDFALGLLRDGEGHIALDMPLEGDLSNPEVGFDQIVGKALGKALAVGSTSLLKFALQPYGAIWTGAEAAFKLATQMQLDPMSFAPGNGELLEEQTRYADKLAQLLGEREGVNLTLCGITGASDIAQLLPDIDQASLAELPAEVSEQLNALSKTRQENLKRYLADVRQVDSKRVYLCKPRIEPGSDISGVLLGL